MDVYVKKTENYLPQQFHIIAYALIAFGIYLIVDSKWYGALLFVVSLAILTASIGIKLDFKKMRYMEYFTIFGIFRGEWQELPNVKYVTIFREKYRQGQNARSISGESSFSYIKISLIITKKFKLHMGTFSEKGKALKKAEFFAKKLNTKLLDYTEGKPVWVKL